MLEFPENRDAPIAATLSFRDRTGLAVDAEFDWRQTGPQSWDIEADTDQGRMLLSGGGSVLSVDGTIRMQAPEAEYPELYRRFASLVADKVSDCDLAPLQHVADAFMLGKRKFVEEFHDPAL